MQMIASVGWLLFGGPRISGKGGADANIWVRGKACTILGNDASAGNYLKGDKPTCH